jgi:hypothetical protein
MSVITVTITDQTFDKKSSEVAYIDHVLDLVATSLRNSQGNISAPTNVLGTNAVGTPNTIVASYTYTASASKV